MSQITEGTRFKINDADVLIRSENVITRTIENDFILVHIGTGIGSTYDSIYTLYLNGRVIWKRLEPGKSAADLVTELSKEFDAGGEKIRNNVIEILAELVHLQMVIMQ